MNHPFGDEQVWHPAQPRNCDVADVEGPVQREEHEGQLVAQRDCRKGESEVADHPTAVSFDIAAADEAIGLQRGDEPQDGESAEAEMGGSPSMDTMAMTNPAIEPSATDSK